MAHLHPATRRSRRRSGERCQPQPGKGSQRPKRSGGRRCGRLESKVSDLVSMKSKPVAICTICRHLRWDIQCANQQCSSRVDGKRCKGCYTSAISIDDWEECDVCSGTGEPTAQHKEIG